MIQRRATNATINSRAETSDAVNLTRAITFYNLCGRLVLCGTLVIPAQAGIQGSQGKRWIPACAGMDEHRRLRGNDESSRI
ncbi:MAG: hypothetical protein JWP89_2359 [Schlesneria sp.]|nr:hypothetical protein [Schlesneria sp.]